MERAIDVSTTVRAAPARVREILVDEPGVLLAGDRSAEDRRSRRFRTTLSVDVGAGAALVQDVVIELDPARADAAEGTTVLPLRWHAAGHERLCPRFAGELVLSADRQGTQLALRGSYSVPLGPLGHFGDGVAGRRLARRSLGAFLAQLARRLDAEVDRRLHSVSDRPAPYPVSLNEPESHPELYVG